MKYNSTRGLVKGVSFETALFSGYAGDGGLFLPERIPEPDWKSWSNLTYPEIVSKIISLFVDQEELSAADLNELINKAYAPDNFDDSTFAPVHLLGSGQIMVLELFHGRTWSFKDYALQLVGALLDHFLARRKRHLNVLIATSGDTGSAAINATKDCEAIDIYVLFPSGGRITEIQGAQMASAQSGNVHVYAADGNSDELDVALKNIFDDSKFVEFHDISSINSINWARIMIQIGHWVYGYFQAATLAGLSCGARVTVAVPTGACGNITAGLIAKRMGLPIDIAVCTTQANDVVGRFIRCGQMHDSPEVAVTLAKAMDISRPYNVERLLHILSDGEYVADCYEYVLPDWLHAKVQSVFSTFQADDADILRTIKAVSSEDAYLICPHTATAVAFARQYNGKNPVLCLATASWYKFPEALENAMVPFVPHEAASDLLKLPKRYVSLERMENWAEVWADKIKNDIKIRTNKVI